MCLLSVILICGAGARWIDTDGGKILIHKVPIEISESQFVRGKIYRPLAAQALNQRPAVLIMGMLMDDMETFSPLAIELARRGYVAVTVNRSMEGVPAGIDQNTVPEILTSSLTFLKSQPFINKDRIGLAAYSLQDISDADEQFLMDNTDSMVLIGSDPSIFQADVNNGQTPEILHINSSIDEYERFRVTDGMNAPHFSFPLNTSVTKATLDWFEKSLRIQNDSPLWFDTARQTSWLREILLLVSALATLALLVPLTDIFHTAFFRDSPASATSISHFTGFSKTGTLALAAIGSIGLLLTFMVYTNTAFSQQSIIRTSDPLVLWIGFYTCMIIIMVVIRNKTQRSLPLNSLVYLLKSLTAALLTFLVIYLFVWIFSRIFMIEFRFLVPVLKPLKSYQVTSFLKYIFPIALFFWICEKSYRVRSKQVLAVIGPLGVLLAIQGILLIFRFPNGFEALSFLLNGNNLNHTGIIWGSLTDTLLFAMIVLGVLLLLQKTIRKSSGNSLIASLICGIVGSWILSTGSLLL